LTQIIIKLDLTSLPLDQTKWFSTFFSLYNSVSCYKHNDVSLRPPR